MAPTPYEAGIPSSGSASAHSKPVKKEIPSLRKVSNPLNTKKNAINAKITSEVKPPAVTTALNTLSENLGVVVISRGFGVILEAAVVVLTGRSWSAKAVGKRIRGETKMNSG